MVVASAAALIRPLAWELPNATGVAVKKKKKLTAHQFGGHFTKP